MRVEDAIEFLELKHPTKQSQKWMDLGCGQGIFTYALAHKLAPKSLIYAVDQFPQHLNPNYHEVKIEFQLKNFEKESVSNQGVDGILMANSIHFIRDKKKFILNCMDQYLPKRKEFLIIEYEMSRANKWVPFPIRFQELEKLFTEIGCTKIHKLNERNSIYGDKMYLASILKN